MSSRPSVGLALIGAGPWGRSYIRTIAALPGVALVALASRQPDAATLAPAGCALYGDWRQAIADRRVDGAIVATPPHTHAAIALAAIAAGLGVLIEKPLTMDVAEARALLAAARGLAGRPVMVDHIHLHHPAFVALKDALRALGPVVALEGTAGRWGPFRPGASVLWDWGPHDVAMALDVVGADPARVAARTLERRSVPAGVGEIVEIELGFASGAKARMTVGNLFEARVRRFSVTCVGGTAVYDSVAPPYLAAQRANGPLEAVATAPDAPLARVVARFGAALASGAADHDDVALGVRVVETLARCDGALSAARS